MCPRSFITARIHSRESRSSALFSFSDFWHGHSAELDRATYETRATQAREQPVPFSHAHHVGAIGLRLPLLPHDGRDLQLRQHSAHQDLHELPFADLDHQPHAGTGARQFPHRRIDPVDARERSAGLRLFQSQHSHQQGSRLRELPRKSGPDAAHLAGELAPDGVVPQLSPESRKVRQAARIHHQDGLSSRRAIRKRSAGA